MSDTYLFTSESVSEGHPDKICDQISDALLDLYLKRDPEARVAIETLATTNRVVVAGETRSLNTPSLEEIEQTIRNTIRHIGYEQEGFHWKTLTLDNFIHTQSPDIAQGVDAASDKDEGAGDQGLMFGYAVLETPELMPAPIGYAHAILKSLADDRHLGKLPRLGPDAKSQVTLRYEGGRPVGIEALVLSTQHAPDVSQVEVKDIVRPYIRQVFPEDWTIPEDKFYVNPTGRFVIGGPDGDTGLTGRKIIVDTYGGAAPHGGGAFSGKDPTKVDRSAAYMCRYLAKNIVAAGLAEKCLIQISYAIGISDPTSLYIRLNEGASVDPHRLQQVLRDMVPLTPRGIRKHLSLNRPIYQPTAAYGHFGRMATAEGLFPWEKLDLVDALRKSL